MRSLLLREPQVAPAQAPRQPLPLGPTPRPALPLQPKVKLAAVEDSPSSDKCFRLVRDAVPGAHGSPHHCALPVAYRGVFTDRTGRDHNVVACIEHAGDLSEWHPVDTWAGSGSRKCAGDGSGQSADCIRRERPRSADVLAGFLTPPHPNAADVERSGE
jgi:hypothetical protein